MGAASCRIFMSYAHDTEEHKRFILDYSNWLNDPGGIDCWIDRYIEDADLPGGWPMWMRNQVKEAKYVLVVCSPKYIARLNHDTEEAGKGLGAKFESTLLLNDFYMNESYTAKYIPVIVDKDHGNCIPDFLKHQTHYNLSDKESSDALYRKITQQPKIVKPKLSKVIDFSNSVTTNASLTEVSSISEPKPIPDIPQYISMKPGTKILQAFFGLPVTRRFAIAKKLNIIEEGESMESPNIDKLCATFLERAFKHKLLAELWSNLFDENIDPNPFKK